MTSRDARLKSNEGDTEIGEPPSIVRNRRHLVEDGYTFATVLADPPWRYTNTASRAAAENHYRTMTVEQICAEPIRQLVSENAHLHLWTTNAFLETAFTVIRASAAGRSRSSSLCAERHSELDRRPGAPDTAGSRFVSGN